MKKKVILIAAAVLIIIALFPFSSRLRDGGTTVWQPVTHIYRIEDLHRLTDAEDGRHGHLTGTVVYILGNEIFNESRVIYDVRYEE